ncbi:MAG: DUF4911 domain-containing protein [Desulfamplus sp.]|nr:DUF4911 domain-containing protein [Desulfamplus sp.]
MSTTQKFYQVDKTRIGFMKFIFEAHDGIAVITTINAGDGMVRIAVAPGCMEDVDSVIGDLKNHFFIRELEPASTTPGLRDSGAFKTPC